MGLKASLTEKEVKVGLKAKIINPNFYLLYLNLNCII